MATKPQELTFTDVINYLDQRARVASCDSPKGQKVVLDYMVRSATFQIRVAGELDNVYSAFGTHLAIARYNELIGAG